jgi:hypothetical protein
MQKRQKRRPLPARARTRSDGSPLTLRDLLDVLTGTRGTRLERICWDLNVDESRVRPAWDAALRGELLESAGADPLTGRAMYRVNDRGRHALGELRRRARHRDRAS